MDTPQSEDEWLLFVEQHPRGSIFHTPEMVRTQRNTRDYEVLALEARTSGRVVAVLVAVRIATLGRWGRPFASRSIFFAEPICEDTADGHQGLRALLREHDRRWGRGCLFAEVRPLFAPQCERGPLEQMGYEWRDYLNYVADLSPLVPSLWNRLHPKCRSDIQRARKKGLTVFEATNPEGVQILYRHLSQSYARSRVPLVDISLFESALRWLTPNRWRILIASYNGQPVASASFLLHAGSIYYWYAGITRTPGLAANACLLWEIMEWGSTHGYYRLDFGGAGWPGEDYGPGKFKARFGADLVHYGRYRKVYSRWRLWLAETGYQAARAWVAPKGERE